MTLKIIKQSTGGLAVFNTETQRIDIWDMSPAVVVEYLMLHDDDPMSWSNAVEAMREAYGWESVGEVLDNLHRKPPPEGH